MVSLESFVHNMKELYMHNQYVCNTFTFTVRNQHYNTGYYPFPNVLYELYLYVQYVLLNKQKKVSDLTWSLYSEDNGSMLPSFSNVYLFPSIARLWEHKQSNL